MRWNSKITDHIGYHLVLVFIIYQLNKLHLQFNICVLKFPWKLKVFIPVPVSLTLLLLIYLLPIILYIHWGLNILQFLRLFQYLHMWSYLKLCHLVMAILDFILPTKNIRLFKEPWKDLYCHDCLNPFSGLLPRFLIGRKII